MTPPIWLDEALRRLPTRPCWTCGRETSRFRLRAKHLVLTRACERARHDLELFRLAAEVPHGIEAGVFHPSSRDVCSAP